MKLLFIHQNFGSFGGAETNIQITADELVKRRHNVALLYCEETGRSTESWKQTFAMRFQLPAPGTPRLAARGEKPQRSGPHQRQAIDAILGSFEPDILYLHTWPDVQILESLLASGLPIVRMVHDHSLYCARSYKYNPLTRTICHRPASGYCAFPCMAAVTRNRSRFPLKWNSLSSHRRELELSKQCKQFIVYSEYSKTELVRNGFEPSKIHIHVPMRCEPDVPTSSFSDRNLILFAGQIIRGKGVDVLLKALARVNARFECLILGDGNHRNYCRRLCARLNLVDRVQFRGYVPREELQKFYLEASVFVVPSVWPEPFGMVGPEAMRFGLPVVAFDSGGIKEWLINKENGFLVPWMDTRSLALRIEELLRNKDLARAMGAAGRERVNRVYSAPHQMDSLERLFFCVASKQSMASASQPNDAKLPFLPDFSAFPASDCVEPLTHSTTANA